MAELRSIARGLRPSILDDLGLVASLNQVVVEAIGRGGLAGEFQVSGTERRLPPDVELAVFRIAQEAVTNVERHASASHLTVTLEFDDRDLRLRVADDGVGFARHQVRDSVDGYSLGLPGMHERARLAGGRLVVRSTPGQGTIGGGPGARTCGNALLTVTADTSRCGRLGDVATIGGAAQSALGPTWRTWSSTPPFVTEPT